MEKFEQPTDKKGVENGSFDFTAEDVLKTLESKGSNMEYVGTATSDFQAEPLVYGLDGKPVVVSDWELELSKDLAGEKSKIQVHQTPEEFPNFLAKKEDYISRSGELDQNMFRFSLDFARLCPEEGQFNSALMGEYVKALATVKAHGQEPMLALYHWPMPRYLLETDKNDNILKGGWENPDAAKHFRFYIDNVVKFLSDEDKLKSALGDSFDAESRDRFLSEGLVQYFISLNEPTSVIGPGYLAGLFPPFKKGRIDLVKQVLSRMVEAHDIARDQVKTRLGSQKNEAKVGIGHAWPYFDGMFGDIAQSILNKYPSDKFERNGEYTDFLGLQYYFRNIAGPSMFVKDKDRIFGEHPDFGDIYPKGIYENLIKMSKAYPRKNIFVSEFGFADRNDIRRPFWILETTRYILEALKAGVPVKGMLLWSLVSNFEWARGMEQKFGLFDESELDKPLQPSPKGEIRSWEAWKAVAGAVQNPSPEKLQTLQKYYETAKAQFEAEVAKQ